jgi:hydroxyacylglutathione hydrolase
VLFRQVLHPDLGCASYVIADTAAGVGAVVDPKWDIAEYLELARGHGFRIEHVIETHNHADHMSGRHRLVAATGASCWVHPLADAQYPHTPFADGAEIALGGSRCGRCTCPAIVPSTPPCS